MGTGFEPGTRCIRIEGSDESGDLVEIALYINTLIVSHSQLRIKILFVSKLEYIYILKLVSNLLDCAE